MPSILIVKCRYNLIKIQEAKSVNYLRSPGYLLGYLIGRLLHFLGARLHDGGVISDRQGNPRLRIIHRGDDFIEQVLDETRDTEQLLRLQMAQYQAEKERKFFEG
jgi:hypothetical protein